MVRKTVAPVPLAVALALLAAPAAAQDIIPLISPGQAAEGVFYRSRMEAEARRQREKDDDPTRSASEGRPAPGTPEYQKQACDNRPIYRRQYGEDHPQVQKLEELCKASGY